MSSTFVAILMGSDSDLPVMQATISVLKTFGIEHEVRVRSAHRTPDAAKAYVKDAEERGCKVFICAAGLAAHLAGAVAGMTTRPVIGVPIDNGPLQGHDALLSTVMMPGGIPVATVAIGKAGAKNAGYLAAQILGVADPSIAEKVKAERAANVIALLAKDEAMQEKLT
ncbi:phosphoribosylaminoimidazole carboxylase [Colwellia sp. PAMC 20917]|jgi:5-(carboxyamino)imidazole ribonucleotide mutase|uniref:5-(carboxyamino)imidazole ribonucleotide mutase n=1 Tax=unclassified Colwellia TaxID=196834 RepID=UPI00087871D6|nr:MULTISPECIES: 5-(carboxyamino)imidazole ribonucleotide mutase [unclassified Colwellia]MBA6363743.1 5-(carboxyamino)imidazole ribonucleotide mutase [Colwellia sp. BRX8-8]AOW77201.1 phosphoribosylaminoimidazole carboxylase [Colwellia sp. PAMC 20917]MBA6338303.1 5-(carboxyamino)imidazole ribonucleotide mutase [Colwellia sp. BRX8-7]MBA6347745.1 5-(carboxyamino)imidazole ribonucleotide mutase [Colwellia sp. BRX8-9]MBA6351738.1 5-(carboxyamino)imidazole ribonucleotide mutase [Colwellia sp. BRX9-1|tara:strand:+ start:11062 stop:11565 length:504 start_codon:yes stop_codon:yes gene_type:complete